MEYNFLKEKKALIKRKAVGDTAKAAALAGVNLVVFYKWMTSKTPWPTVDIRNYTALKTVIEEREMETQIATHPGKDVFDQNKFAMIVSTLRTNMELSLREMAHRVGISAATLSRIESGKAPDIESFYKICIWAEWEDIKDFAKK